VSPSPPTSRAGGSAAQHQRYSSVERGSDMIVLVASDAANPGNRTYACSSGEITVAVGNAEQWHALAVCLGRPELAYEGAWDVVSRAAPHGPVARVVEGMLAEHDAPSWMRRLDAHGVPCRVV